MAEQKLSKGERRRQNILQWLKKNGKITVQEMVSEFGISEATARRDLELLEAEAPVIRTIGGAMYDGFHSMKEYSFQEREQFSYLEKEKIAAAAAKLIREGDVIGLTGGTTSFVIARAIKTRKNITVVTNAVNIAMELAGNKDIQLVVTGGIVRGNSFELCGPLAEGMIQQVHIGKMFLGIDGVNLKQGLATYSEQEAAIARAFIGRAVQTYAVFDHTKVGRTSLFTVTPLQNLAGCITDRPLPKEMMHELERQGIDLYIAED